MSLKLAEFARHLDERVRCGGRSMSRAEAADALGVGLRFKKDDGGRAAAGGDEAFPMLYRGSDGDCSVRALCILTGAPYAECHSRIMKWPRRRRWDAIDETYAELGLRRIELKPRGSKGYPTLTEAHREYGNMIAMVATERSDGRRITHATAVVDGVLRDAWDCRVRRDHPSAIAEKARVVYTPKPETPALTRAAVREWREEAERDAARPAAKPPRLGRSLF